MTGSIKFGMILLVAGTLIACQNNFEVATGISQAVEDNKTASNIIEWESSPAHPEVLFKKWNQLVKDGESLEKISAEICARLTTLPAVQLTIFEQELGKKENQALIAPCRNDLENTLNDYYLAQRPKMKTHVGQKNWSAGFKFPENVQTRDLSNGYFAWSGDVARKEIVLTFDDGPSNEHTESILKSLKAVNAKAHFFSLGKNAQLNPGIVKKIAADGHAIGSHSMTHACLAPNTICQGKNGFAMSYEQALAEIRGAHQVLHDILGWVDPIFRFPYGEASRELKEFLRQNQVGEFAWNMDSEDWRATSNIQLLDKALSEVERAGRGIILFHDVQRRTAEVMPEFLKEIYARGYSLVLLQPADPSARYHSKLVRNPNKP